MKVEEYHNWELEMAIRKSDKDQMQLAKDAGIDAAKLSHIKRGRMRPTDEEEKAIAAALGFPVSKLFINKTD
jgi:transcriptional regulator with XRE-family HTH domain